MSERIEVSMDDLHADGIQEAVEAEALASVIPGGVYLAKGTDYKVFVNEDDDRQVASLRVQLYDEDGRELKRIRVRVSHQRRMAYGRPDKATRLYLALAKAVDVDPNEPVEVYTTALNSYFRISFNDAFAVKEEDLHDQHMDKTANAKGDVWVTFNGTSDEANEYRTFYVGKGYDAKYLTNTFFPENA